MSNSIFDWPASLKRFVRFTSAKAEDVNDALDQLSAGLDTVEANIARAVKLPSGTADQTLALSPAQRANLLLSFDALGNVTAVAGGGRFRGDWVTATLYVPSDYVRDAVSKNIYSTVSQHTSGVLATDISAGRLRLAIDVADVEAQRVLAQTAATTATTQAGTATTQAGIATSASSTAVSARDAAIAARDAAELSFDSFDDRYLGPKASPPTLDNDGNALTEGAMYWDSAIKRMCVWSGTEWQVTYDAAISIHAAPSKATPADADEIGLSDSAASWGLKKLTFANLKAWIGSLFVSKSGDTINGNLNFSGTGRRITGDFSNATLANRLMLQTNVADAGTTLGLIPNGTGALSQIILGTVAGGSNDTRMRLYATATECAIVTDMTGTGSYVDLNVYVSGAARLRIDKTTGAVLSVSGALGYGTGAGGAVSQATSKSTAVTLNKPCGRVTMFNNPTDFPAESAIPAGGEILFQVNNNLVTLTDSVIALPVAASSYLVQVLYVNTGLFVVRVVNKTGASLSEQISINFTVIKSTLS